MKANALKFSALFSSCQRAAVPSVSNPGCVIQILSLKTNNQMQSYSPLALSLSYQSSLPEKTSSVFTYIYTAQGESEGEMLIQDC